MRSKKNERGFSLIEVLVGITLVAVIMVGLAQIFTLSIMNNRRSNDLSSGTFLAQQVIDSLRTLTAAELSNFPLTDEPIDVNGDGTVDFRRVTQIQASGNSYQINILVFLPSDMGLITTAMLLGNPDDYKVKAHIHTVIGR